MKPNRKMKNCPSTNILPLTDSAITAEKNILWHSPFKCLMGFKKACLKNRYFWKVKMSLSFYRRPWVLKKSKWAAAQQESQIITHNTESCFSHFLFFSLPLLLWYLRFIVCSISCWVLCQSSGWVVEYSKYKIIFYFVVFIHLWHTSRLSLK